MCQTTHLKILCLVTFSDLTLTLTWAKYEKISLVSTFVRSLGVHMESFGRKMLRLRSLRSATCKHPILTFDLTLTWHVTSILNFRNWFGSISSRSFECCLIRLSTSIRYWDSTGGRIQPPPPRLWWVQEQPRRWLVNSGRLLATPISGRGLFRTPLEISGSYRSIFKIQTAFVSPQHDLHF